MPDAPRESADLTDYEVLDSADTLAGEPGDDPLDRGVVTPHRWSSAMRYGSTADEQRAGLTLDQRLRREIPDEPGYYSNEPLPDGVHWDGQATEDDIAGRTADDGEMQQRSGRLVRATSEDAVFFSWESDTVARDVGADGGGAAAEEAAVHITDDSGTDEAEPGTIQPGWNNPGSGDGQGLR